MDGFVIVEARLRDAHLIATEAICHLPIVETRCARFVRRPLKKGAGL
jgi:hypothetical protein